MVVEIDNLVNIEAKLEGIGDADTLDRELNSKVDHKDVEHNTKKLLAKNNIKESLELTRKDIDTKIASKGIELSFETKIVDLNDESGYKKKVIIVLIAKKVYLNILEPILLISKL